MKIGICALGQDLNSLISPTFGRAPYFLIFDLDTNKLEVIPNSAFNSPRGAGVASAQVVVSQKVKAVICTNFGPNSFSVLKMAGIKVYCGAVGITVKETIERYRKNELKEVETPTMPGHFGFGRGRRFGLGPGRGPGRIR